MPITIGALMVKQIYHWLGVYKGIVTPPKERDFS